MPFVEWDTSFNTGITQFDEHHQHLVDLLNKTYDDYILGAPDDAFGAVLTGLIEYAGYHFDAEASWMREHSYPKLTEHLREHDSFVLKATRFQQDFQNGNVSISLDVLTFLKTWLKHHILESDADYGRFIRQAE
ncbi:MAG: hypothetical protein A2076_12620 [Geobacteraceae bacterium GWC2_53_11]|nr:MAG: hypothetical protein A2076_12620 [Geobacteraceae bacterium GWC2_53_11]